ncbi:MAG: lysophospholipid acyltransferase family protein [Phycisphaerales bacterium]|nr:lysophospholipid acyltransferase family protein [Phycisphaerales bacterium]
MGAIFYRTLRNAVRLVRIQTIRQTALNSDRVCRAGGFVLACTHISHIEPIVLSAAMRRQVHWVARQEFYRYGVARFILNASGAVPIDRFGSPIIGVRTAAQLARVGRCVGIFPEGGIAKGSQSVLGGGSIKGGACSIAIDASVPIVPAVILGTDGLTTVKSWIPLPRKPVFFAFGRDIHPPTSGGPRRSRRLQMKHAVEQEFRAVYSELVAALDSDHSKLTAAIDSRPIEPN